MIARDRTSHSSFFVDAGVGACGAAAGVAVVASVIFVMSSDLLAFADSLDSSSSSE